MKNLNKAVLGAAVLSALALSGNVAALDWFSSKGDNFCSKSENTGSQLCTNIRLLSSGAIVNDKFGDKNAKHGSLLVGFQHDENQEIYQLAYDEHKGTGVASEFTGLENIQMLYDPDIRNAKESEQADELEEAQDRIDEAEKALASAESSVSDANGDAVDFVAKTKANLEGDLGEAANVDCSLGVKSPLGWESGLFTADGLLHLVLPSFTLASIMLPLFIRLIRAEMMEVLQSEYVKFAWAKGISPRRIYFLHALKNTMLPVITVGGVQIGTMVAYTILTETVFQWPGMGFLFLEAVNRVDTPLIVAYLIVVGAIFVVTNTIVDLIYGLVNPTVKLAGGK